MAQTEKLNMEKKKVASKYGIVFFYGKSDYYSQFHPCEFTIDGIKYSCCEQYMMHQKAVIFGDKEMANQILKETRPREMKKCGRRVKNFVDEEWTRKCRQIVFDGNYAKFSQNEHLKKALLDTGDKLIAEASPRDKRWGIGMAKTNKNALKPELWKGKNWLGIAIMNVREELQGEESK